MVKAKVVSALLYASMFLFLADGAVAMVDDLQVSFERALLGAPQWFPSVLARAAGGWRLSWGEQICFDVLVFRAELWCCKSTLVVRKAWAAAQALPGRTFAASSKSLLLQIGLPEVFEMDEWNSFISNGEPVLPGYKSLVKSCLEESSEAAWLESIRTSQADKLHLLSQHGPSSGAARLLDSGSLDVLSAADDWEKFRLGLVPLSVVSGGGRVCPLCGLGNHGNAHLLASCGELCVERQSFFVHIDSIWANELHLAPPADWSTSILCANLELTRLGASVEYVSKIVTKLSGKG